QRTSDIRRRFGQRSAGARDRHDCLRCACPPVHTFEPGFIDSIRMHRSGLLAAALTIWRWGRQSRMKRGIPLGSFEHWGGWVRDPLLALGCPDPVDRIRQITERDPARQRVIEMFAGWWEAHKDNAVRAVAPEVREIIDPNQRGRQYVARAVQGLIGTRQGGFTLERVGELPNRRKAGALYRLRQVSPPGHGADSSASSAFGAKSDGKTTVFAAPDGADAPADVTDDPDVIRNTDLGANSENSAENVGLDVGSADDADDADASRYHADRRDEEVF